MNARKKMSHLLMTLMLVLAAVPWGSHVSAQAETINVVFKVFLQLEGQEANAQSQISYDVLNSEKTEFLYSYRSQEPPAESLSLPEGNYYFRLYDGGGFVREGVEIMPEKVLQTISNQTEEDKAENKTKRSLDEIGSVLTQGDGTKVYDVPFSVHAGPTLVNGDTVEIEIYLADQATITANESSGDEEDGPETSEPVPPSLSTITFSVLDENQAPVPNVTLQLGELQATTDENGSASFRDVAAGDYMISIASLPEGYTGSLEDLLSVGSDDQTLTLNIQTAAPAVGSILFTVLDQNGTAVPGVGILVGETELTTGETGEASISELPVADYNYSVTSLPDGYSAEVADLVTVLADQQVAPVIYINKNAPQVGGVRFEVKDQNAEAFANVVIQIEGQEVTTNENGVALVPELPVGTFNYSVPATAAYSETYGEVIVAEGEVLENVVVNRIPQTATASFTVTDEEGLPVSGAVVNISDQQVTTNEEGRASIDLPMGDYEYSLAALPEGYTGDATGLVSVTSEGVSTPISVAKAAQTGSVRIEVSDQNEAPAANVVIQIAEQEVTTDESGVASLADLPIGTLNYTVPATETFAETYGEVTVAEGEVLETVRVNRIPQTGVASFVVTDQAGVPVEGAVINIADQQVTTNAEGQASLAELPVGDYSYSVARLPEGYVGEATGSLTVSSEAGEAVAIAVEKAPEVGTASLKVVDQNEAAVVGAVIRIAEQEISTNEEGLATLPDLLVGEHSYTVSSLPEGYSGEGSGTLTVTAGETATATISVTKAPTVGNASLTVLDQNDAPVASAVISLNEQEYTTNAEGVAVISDLTVGDYSYTVSSLPEGYSGEGSGTLTVTAGETATATISVTKAPTVGTATFTVLDQENNKLEGVTIEINEGTITTNAEGLAQATDLPAGEHTYRVTALPEGYSGDVSGTITVQAGETVNETLSVTRDPRYGNVTFTVKDQEGQPVVGAVIRLNEKDFTTNAEGQAIILELQAGKEYAYQLTSLPEGYTGEAEGSLTISQDQTAEEAIEVSRTLAKGQLSVVVMDQTEAAVEGAVIQLAEGTEATTNEQGQAVFNEVTPKTYQVSIKQLPERYSHDLAPQEVVMTEGATESLDLSVNRQITTRQINLRVLDQEDQPVEGATILLNDQTLTTNAEGRVSLADLNPATYPYDITGLPEGYQGAHQGEVTLTEAEDITQDIRVERIIEPGQATITVVDQQDQAVEGATVKFGGLSQATDSNGQTTFEGLEPGNYYYSVTEVPEAYSLLEDAEEQRAEIAEADTFEASLEVDKKPEVGRIDLKLVNSQNEPIENAKVKIGEIEVTTNADGVASFIDLAPGEYSFEVTQAPEGYLLETTAARLTVAANQTVTQTVVLQTKPEERSSESSESTSESQESEADESEVAEATQRYVDDATGVEVLVNPADAGKVVKLQVTKVPQPLDPLPAALQNMNADVYEVVLLDRNNAPVQLTRVAQVKLPTQPVTSQLKVVRISGANTSTLTFSLFNQKVNFSTQELGRFAIVYGEKAVESESSSETSSQISSDTTSESVSTSISVSKTTDVEANLPNTGEIRNVWLVALAVLLGLLGITLVVRKRGTNKQ
ncbi:carboxypeptidase regulatory-like domain-containing protein [Fundicoccus sp. Sow4_D5]|uniref:carboxypeptidase regulatory-like domain-containing protein n=1 Tax=Fundicoccus sp. Sow4_D5 TaxID=3438782 RepID=UPI003F93226F